MTFLCLIKNKIYIKWILNGYKINEEILKKNISKGFLINMNYDLIINKLEIYNFSKMNILNNIKFFFFFFKLKFIYYIMGSIESLYIKNIYVCVYVYV